MTESPTSPSFDAEALACHYARLRNFIRRAISDEEEASDIAQESYLRLVRYGEGREVRNGEWLLYRIARNLIVDRFRRRSTHPEDAVEPERFVSRPELASGIDPGRVAVARERVRRVEEAVLALPERCREVFLLQRFGGLSYSEIARRLSISQGTVEKHMARAILACREAVDLVDS